MRRLEWLARLTELQASEYTQLESTPEELLPPTVTWPATGPPRLDREGLGELRDAIREAGRSVGYEYGLADGPPLASAEQKALIDLEVARALHTRMRCSRHDAASPGVWMYVATMLGPELVRWRFDSGDGVGDARFGHQRLRNFYGRLWWRAELLQDRGAEDPYWLLRELGEDELVQITERPNASGYRPLAVGLGRHLLKAFNPEVHSNRSLILRDAMKRLVRRLPLACIEALDADTLDEVLAGMFRDTIVGLGLSLESPQLQLVPRPRTAPAGAGPSQKATRDALTARVRTLVRLLPHDAFLAVTRLLRLPLDPLPRREEVVVAAVGAPQALVAPLSEEAAAAMVPLLDTGSNGAGRAVLAEWLLGRPVGPGEIAAPGPEPPSPDAPNGSCLELLDTMLSELDEQVRGMVLEFYRYRRPTLKIGPSHRMSRASVKRAIDDAVGGLRERHGSAAAVVLRAEWRHGLLGEGLLHRAVYAEATVGWEDVHLLADVSGPRSWRLVDGEWLTSRKVSWLRALIAELKELASETDVVDGAVLRAWRAAREDVTEELARVVVTAVLGRELREDGG